MIEIVVPATTLFDERTNQFHKTKETTLQLEHSLLSLSKWEAKWQTPFLTDEPHSEEKSLDYFRCMTINRGVDPLVYRAIKPAQFAAIKAYISSPQTATTVNKIEQPSNGHKQVLTSELIYYYMIAYNIPFECEKWHLNRLIMLIRICDVKNQPQKKMSNADFARIKAERRKARKRK